MGAEQLKISAVQCSAHGTDAQMLRGAARSRAQAQAAVSGLQGLLLAPCGQGSRCAASPRDASAVGQGSGEGQPSYGGGRGPQCDQWLLSCLVHRTVLVKPKGRAGAVC